jgi:hypothetical protein
MVVLGISDTDTRRVLLVGKNDLRGSFDDFLLGRSVENGPTAPGFQGRSKIGSLVQAFGRPK